MKDQVWRTHLAADFAGENFGLAAGTGSTQPGRRRRRRALEDLVGDDLVPLLHVVLDLTLRQLLEGLHAGHRVPFPGLVQARFAFLCHEGFVPGGEQVRGHRVQVDKAGRWRTPSAVPAAVQVAHGAHGGEGGLVHHPGSEEFVLAGGLAHSGVLLLVLIVQPKAQKVCRSGQGRPVEVARIQPGDAEPVARFVPEWHQRDHTM